MELGQEELSRVSRAVPGNAVRVAADAGSDLENGDRKGGRGEGLRLKFEYSRSWRRNKERARAPGYLLEPQEESRLTIFCAFLERS